MARREASHRANTALNRWGGLSQGDAPPLAVAFYERVSTDEQEERGTIKAQTNYLQDKYRPDFRPDAPTPMTLVGDYIDDGWSGAIPLQDRPSGARLLSDAKAGRLKVVIVYKLDRLGRTARVLLDAHDELERLGVAILSASEPFDTRPGPMQAIGKFVFQLLASIAELERSTILQRTLGGRERVARDGKFVNGAVPFGFEVDRAGFLVPSERVLSSLGMTESEAVREIFRRIAGGESCYAVAEWLDAAGVPSVRRLHSKEHHRTIEVTRDSRVGSYAGVWTNRRVWETIRNPVHKGMRTLHFGMSVVEQLEGTALVASELWELANARMRANNRWSGDHDGWIYLLSNLIVCDAELPDGGRCGLHYTGGAANGYRYYACNGNDRVSVKRRGCRCSARGLRADKVETALWSDLVWHIRHPEDSLEELRALIGERQQEHSKGALERLALQQRHHELELARVALRRALREGKRPAREVEEDLMANADLIAVVQRNEERLEATLEVTDALETRLSSTARLLRHLQAEIDDIEATDDRSAKRRIIADLVGEIRVSDPRSREPQLEVTYLFAPEGATQPTTEALDLANLRLQSGYSRTRGCRRHPTRGHNRCV